MEITLFPAQNGDSLLVSWDERFHVLIDTGYAETYAAYLKPLLLKLAQSGISLEYCVITHVDADHIEGALRGLFVENGMSTDPKVVSIRQVWHNSYKHLGLVGHIQLSNKDRFGLKALIARGMTTTTRKHISSHSISTHQGSSLSALLTLNKYAWNKDFEEEAVVGPHRHIINSTTEFVILSPTTTQLNRLAKKWEVDLLKLGIQKGIIGNPLLDEAYEYWLAQHNKHLVSQPKPIATRSYSINDMLAHPFVEDNSLTNGSSIAFVIKTKEARVLLLSDAYPSVVEASLRVVYAEESIPIWFDAIKVSHHGSFANNSPSLLQLTDSTVYLISTDGSKHLHPDPQTVAWIVTRPLKKGTIRRLYFNYQTPTSQLFENPSWQDTYNYRVIYSSHEVPISVTL